MTPFERRIERVTRRVLETRVDLLSVMMAELGLDEDDVRARLVTLVDALRSPKVEETIFDAGRRMPMAVDERSNGTPPRIRYNEELLSRVDDAEILNALARPVAQITELAAVAVALIFQIDDEQTLRDLTSKVARRPDIVVVRAAEIPAWVALRIETMLERLKRMCAHLGRASAFDDEGADEVRDRVLGSRSWPEWVDVSDTAWAGRAVEGVREALEDTPQMRYADAVTELLWDSLALSPQSFLRHAGRTLRGEGGELEDVTLLLRALAAAVGSTGELVSDDVRDWTAYAEVADAWESLNRHEKAMFGPVLLGDTIPPASPLEPARFAFGLEEPRELPWNAPLVCWTVREQTALRDLLIGYLKTLPGHTDDALEGFPDLHQENEPALKTGDRSRSIGVQVVALLADTELAIAASISRAWSACLHRVIEQFEALNSDERATLNRTLRAAYDEMFPDSAPIWARRFYDLERRSATDAFRQLVTTPNDLFRTPVILDPFRDPERNELAPYPTLVFPVGIGTGGRVPFFVPVVALTSTLQGAALRVRVVDVPAGMHGQCGWICDRGLHLNKLSSQAVDLILRAVRGDALQMAVFDS